MQPIQRAEGGDNRETPRAVEVTQTNWARLKFTTEAQSESDTGLGAAHWPDFHQSHHFTLLESFQDGSEQKTAPCNVPLQPTLICTILADTVIALDSLLLNYIRSSNKSSSQPFLSDVAAARASSQQSQRRRMLVLSLPSPAPPVSANALHLETTGNGTAPAR